MAASIRKVPIDQFCKDNGIERNSMKHLFRKYPDLKVKIIGLRSRWVNLDKWERILKSA